jgi:hypothetical protein
MYYYAECRYAECHYAECRYALRHYRVTMWRPYRSENYTIKKVYKIGPRCKEICMPLVSWQEGAVNLRRGGPPPPPFDF